MWRQIREPVIHRPRNLASASRFPNQFQPGLPIGTARSQETLSQHSAEGGPQDWARKDLEARARSRR